VQLNGMIVPRLRFPTLSLNQNPWPYRPEAWGSFKDRIAAWAKRRSMVRAMRTTDVYGWTSQYLRDLVCGWHKFSPRRSEIFYNGLPEQWINRAATSTALADRPMEIVTVSNVSPYKRQDLVIKALAMLVKRPGLAKLVYRIVGKIDPPSYRDELVALANSHGVGDNVIIEGRVSEGRVREAFSSARCFVLMSVCESFGIPVIEAMSHGTPVVASNCCALPEVCSNAADLAPVDDVAGLAQRLERVLINNDYAETLRQAGTQRVRQFTWNATSRKMVDSLELITADRRPT
jgi:glycosyltransferase involved in cell wall biosynthesis